MTGALEAHAQPRRGLALGLAVLVIGAGLLALALASRPSGLAPPPAIPLVAAGPTPTPTPTPTLAAQPRQRSAPIVAVRPRSEQSRDLAAFRRRATSHVPAAWEAGFYPLYDLAGRTFGVNWLLIASIHRQETSFSTEPDTYHGLNFAGCCGGPMQFNVKNGPVTTWSLVADAYRTAARPPGYDHATSHHPSIYDDYDAIMAGAQLLSTDGATVALDGGAWQAAYGYYGHDTTGVTYADQVLARAIGWSQQGFCINCELDPGLVDAVHAAYGAPVLAELEAVAAAKAKAMAKAKAERAAQDRAAARSAHTSSV